MASAADEPAAKSKVLNINLGILGHVDRRARAL